MSVYESRTRRLQNLLRRNGVDAAVILSLGSYLYFTGDVRKQPRVVIPSEGEPFLIVFESEEEEAKNNTWIRDVRTYRSLHQMMAAIMTAAKEQKWKKVGFEFDFFLPAFLNERFKMAVPTVEVVDIHELVTSLKMVKDEQEMGLIRKAAEIAVEGMKTAIEYVEEGVTENEVAVYFISGEGEVEIDGGRFYGSSDTCFFVPAGSEVEIRNTGKEALRVLVSRAPPPKEWIRVIVHVAYLVIALPMVIWVYRKRTDKPMHQKREATHDHSSPETPSKDHSVRL